MNELIESLVALLERGIVVEPYGTDWPNRTGAFRIRLSDDETEAAEEQSQQQGMGW